MAYDATAKKGKAFLIAKGATNIGGFKTKQMTLNSETVDVTTTDDMTNRWRQLLAATGVKSISFTGSGIIKDTAAQQALWNDCAAQTLDTYTITVDGVGTFAGSYQITQIQSGGEFNGEETFDVTLESGGDITITLEA